MVNFRPIAHPTTANSSPARPVRAASDRPHPAEDKLHHAILRRAIQHGRDLLANTHSLIGPEPADSAHRFSPINLRCQNRQIRNRSVSRSSRSMPTSRITAFVQARSPWNVPLTVATDRRSTVLVRTNFNVAGS